MLLKLKEVDLERTQKTNPTNPRTKPNSSRSPETKPERRDSGPGVRGKRMLRKFTTTAAERFVTLMSRTQLVVKH